MSSDASATTRDTYARRLLVYGASGHGKVVADAASAAGWQVDGFADDDAGKQGRLWLGHAVVATGFEQTTAYLRDSDAEVVVAVGDNAARAELFRRLRDADLRIATIVHPAAVVARSAIVGAGTVVFAGAIINPDVEIGRNVIINTAASIDHDCRIGDHVHVSPGARLGGAVSVGTGSWIGIGASVRQCIRVGSWSVVGVGAAVVKDVPDGVVAFGNPATARWSRGS